ncbi:proto-oncogene tyrosine-protein kinase receptor Ret [Patella vulgata]|uniref:proto-oncogene tyrosine-protein kinase receptor Ret n=1 Tax=Patella vulgata TaxID=6465 RepID=UPI0024A8CB0D|nr:proto-oncogene tyrosine-protein kinase receptor Ret [Patella vulgata]
MEIKIWIYIFFNLILIKGSCSLYFPKKSYRVLINGNSMAGSTITQIRAFNHVDKSCETSTISYSIAPADNLAPSKAITVDTDSGEIRQTVRINNYQLKDNTQFQMKAVCNDASLMVEPALATLNLSVSFDLEQLQNAPAESLEDAVNKLCWPETEYSFKLEENSKERLLYTLKQKDINPIQLLFSINPSTDTAMNSYLSKNFRISDNGLQLILKQELDREEKDNINFNVTCDLKIDGQSVGSSQQPFFVVVSDVDDNPPFFQRTNLQIQEINITNGELTKKLPPFLDLDIVGVDKDTYNISFTKGADQVVKVERFLSFTRCVESKKCDKPKVSTFFLELQVKKGESLSSLSPFSSFDVHITDTKYKRRDSKYSNTAILRFILDEVGEVAPAANTPPFQTQLSRNAAKYTQVLVLSSASNRIMSEAVEYSLLGSDHMLGITRTGIIYVKNTTKLVGFVGSTVDLNVSRSGEDATVVTIKIDGVKSGYSTCDNGCSESQNKETCKSRCGYGAPASKCHWREGEDNLSRKYATCRPNTKTCPDGVCDDLEELNQLICPQDCVKKRPMGEGFLKTDSRRGIGLAKSPCWCDGEDGNVQCSCGLERPSHINPNLTSDFQTEVKHKPANKPASSTSKQATVMRNVEPKDKGSSESCDASCRTAVAAAVSCALAILLLLVTVWLILKKRRKQSRILKHVGSSLSMTAMPSNYVADMDRRLSFSSPQRSSSPKSRDIEIDVNWEFPRDNLILEDNLGEGEFGQVVRGRAYGLDVEDVYTTVAVKMLKPDASESEYRDLMSELNLLKEVDHPNVIRLLGACTKKDPFYVIVEYCEFGSLKNYLRKCKYRGRRSWEDKQNQHDGSYENETGVVLTIRDLLSFAWQTTRGMEYLSQMKLVHRDLAARNILMTTGKQLKISDFGLSRDVYEADTYLKMSKGRLPVKWMAPESLYAQIYTAKSDIWSFGVVLWEIVTLGANPYPGIPPERLFNLLKTGYRMDRPDDCPDELYAIMQKCWKAKPEDRPSFAALSYILDRMLQFRVGYLELQGDCEYLQDKTTVL